ncbi:MAG: hypothetical protein AB1626_02425, partial [Candidatus Micrarchaeota archaeon]
TWGAKGGKTLRFSGAREYEPPAFGVRPLKNLEVKRYMERTESAEALGLAGEARRILEAVRAYRTKATLPTPWLARMEVNLRLIAQKLGEVRGDAQQPAAPRPPGGAITALEQLRRKSPRGKGK